MSGSGGIRTHETQKGSGLANLCNWPLCDASILNSKFYKASKNSCIITKMFLIE